MNDKQAVQVFKTLLEGRASRMQLAELTGANPKSVGRLLAEMKKQEMIYVIDYSKEADGRNRVKMYTFGKNEDAQPVRSMSQEERSRRNYLKKMRKLKQKKLPVPITTFVGGKSLWQ